MKRCITIGLPTLLFNGMLFVGEAPGEVEEELGIPFVGRAGNLFDGLLVKVGINRKACVVTNVFHIRPTGNDVMLFFTDDPEEGAPKFLTYPYLGRFLKKEFASEIERLRFETDTIGPQVVVALGRVALWALTGRSAISKEHGKVLMAGGLRVVPCYHPAYLLRANNAQRDAMALGALLTAKNLCN